jgi:hypothetical protein
VLVSVLCFCFALSTLSAVEGSFYGIRHYNSYTNNYWRWPNVYWWTQTPATPAVATPSPTATSPTSAPTQTATPSPSNSPTPATNAKNLAALSVWDLTYGDGPQIIHLDTTVTHNGNPSIRIDQHTSADGNPGREVNTYGMISIKPSDHVVFKCWIKVTTSSLPVDPCGAGARIGIDFYNAKRIGSLEAPTYPDTAQGIYQNYVTWGTNGWVQRTIEFTVPQSMPADGYAGYAAGGSYTPTGMILWMQVQHANDPGQGWFSEPELYINP